MTKLASIRPKIETAAVVLMLAMSAWAWGQIPSGASMAVHWGISGQPDGFAPKAVGLLVLPIIMAFAYALSEWVMAREIHQENLQKSQLVADAAMYGATLLIMGAHAMIILTALGQNVPISTFISIGVGLLLISVGGLMAAGKTERNTSVGVRTPWTLRSDTCWHKINRLGGWIMVLMGVGTIVGGMFNLVATVASILIGVVFTLALYPYSYFVWKSEQGQAS